ncbi:MAG: NAD(P)-dependent oxidoreductase [Rhodobacteraceae bacterium]|nr:MAG: NAD(P)-dependent oxidoreductase [Paracoccaceae bacterium]
MTGDSTRDIAVIGFGEAGRAFASGWEQEICARVVCYDVKLDAPDTASSIRDAATSLGVLPAVSRAEALADARVVFCLVTADQAVTAARDCAPYLSQGALWLDCNSCAPDSKRMAAEIVADAGGVYVDVAVMSPVHPKLHRTPLLISGPGADAAVERLAALGMQTRGIDDQVGSASSIKMIRSVMIKGLEALTAECFLAARKAGVADEVLGSLMASNPEMTWDERAAYNLERMMEHGIRRAAEMREVVHTLDGLGLPSALTAAVAEWHERIGEMGLKEREGDLSARAQEILERL